MASASAEKAKNECLNATYAVNRSDPSFHKRKLYQEERKIKQEWVISLFDAMVMAGKMQDDATFPRMEQIRPCLVAVAKEICSKQTPVTEWLFGDDLPKLEMFPNLKNSQASLNKNHRIGIGHMTKIKELGMLIKNPGYQHTGSEKRERLGLQKIPKQLLLAGKRKQGRKGRKGNVYKVLQGIRME